MLSRRHRRRRFPTNEVESRLRFMPILAVIVALVIVFYLGSIVLEYFGVGNSVRSAAVELTVEDRGVISVSLEGSQKKQAESGIKLYAGDTAESGPGNHASLTYFDGTVLRLDQNTSVKVVESEHGAEESMLEAELLTGMLWVRTPERLTFSGTIVRTIVTPSFTATLPSETEAVITADSVAVYSADGLGIALDIPDTEGQYYVGEGQQFILPATANKSESLYSYRQPITPDRDRSTFINESRRANQPVNSSGSLALESGTGSDAPLVVVSPLEGAAVSESTVEVTGRYGINVDKVRINGYMAALDEDEGTFSQEIALPDEDTVAITIEAVDFNGIVLEEVRRTVTRDRVAPTAPTITAPAAGGTTYKTNLEQFELKGTVPEGTIGVLVNDYRLQLFNPGDTTWTYLASVRLENLKLGENVFNVYAIGANTLKSEPATITIIVGDGDEGVVSSASSAPGTSGSASSEPEQVEESTLPDNAPLQPGTLTVEKPEAGTTHTTSEVEFLIEGSVPASTDSVWVNGYKLRLYSPGKTFWNYIASVELGTMKEGANTYKVNARDKEGNIIDTLTYTITYNP